jgi:hypothetical protein
MLFGARQMASQEWYPSNSCKKARHGQFLGDNPPCFVIASPRRLKQLQQKCSINVPHDAQPDGTAFGRIATAHFPLGPGSRLHSRLRHKGKLAANLRPMAPISRVIAAENATVRLGNIWPTDMRRAFRTDEQAAPCTHWLRKRDPFW